MKLKNLKVGDICFPTNEDQISSYYTKCIKIKKSTHFMINSLSDKNSSSYHVDSIKIIPSNRIIKDKYYIQLLLSNGGYSIKKRDGKISNIK